MRYLVAALVSALLAAPCLAQSGAARTAPNGEPRVTATLHEAQGPATAFLGVGTIQLDNNVPFDRDPQDDGFIGNRFNPPAGTHSVASASFRVAGNYVSFGSVGSIVMTIWDPTGTGANVLQRQIVTNAPGLSFGATGTITDVTVMAPLAAPVLGHTGSFLGGLRNTFYDACGGNSNLNSTCDGVALTEGTTDPGMGFNAVRLLFTGPFNPTSVVSLGTSGQAIAGRNAIFRVTGDNLPVELMQFEIE